MPYKDPEKKREYDQQRYLAYKPFIRLRQEERRRTTVTKQEADAAYRRGRRAAAREILNELRTCLKEVGFSDPKNCTYLTQPERRMQAVARRLAR